MFVYVPRLCYGKFDRHRPLTIGPRFACPNYLKLGTHLSSFVLSIPSRLVVMESQLLKRHPRDSSSAHSQPAPLKRSKTTKELYTDPEIPVPSSSPEVAAPVPVVVMHPKPCIGVRRHSVSYS